MRKVIVEIKPGEQAKRAQEILWEKIEYFNILEILKIDLEKGSKLMLAEIKMREGFTLDTSSEILATEILQVLKVDKNVNKHTCLCKIRMGGDAFSRLKDMSPEVLAKLMKVPLPEDDEKDITEILKHIDADAFFQRMKRDYDLDVIWTTPHFMSKNKVIRSCIGDQENIKRYLEMMKAEGEIVNISFQKPTYEPYDLLMILTDKQREIVIAAKQHGYLAFPKRINSTQLAKRVGLSKSTMIQHLRKAEIRIWETILAGY